MASETAAAIIIEFQGGWDVVERRHCYFGEAVEGPRARRLRLECFAKRLSRTV